MSADPEVIRIESRLTEARLAEERARVRVKELSEALEAAKSAEAIARDSDQATVLEAELERLPWKEAASKKCDYVRDAPHELVEKIRAAKGGFKGSEHHFAASGTEPTLFRFRRSSKA
jgi:hypothetical protein